MMARNSSSPNATRLPLLSLLVVGLVLLCRFECGRASGEDEQEHEHEHEHEHEDVDDESVPWEWAGLVHLEAGTYWWYAGARNGAYADDSMELVYIAESSITDAEPHATEAWALDAIDLETEGVVSMGEKVYHLEFDKTSLISRYQVNIPSEGDYVFFTQHFPIEFESCESGHFFKNDALEDVEFSAEEAHAGHDHGDEGDDADSHAHHDHGGSGTGAEWEWSGAFRVTNGTYSWTAAKVDGKYGHGDASMRMYVAYSSLADGTEAIEALEPAAQTALSSCAYTIDVHAYRDAQVLTPLEYSSTVYKLHFDEQSSLSLWKMVFNVESEATVVIFAEHLPTEFEGEDTGHYFKDSGGKDIEPIAEKPDSDSTEAEWGLTIGATFLVMLISLIGLLTLIPIVSVYVQLVIPFLSAFAAGTLIGAAFFLIFAEAYLNIGTEQKGTDQTWRWGTVIVAGYFSCLVIDCLVTMFTSASINDADNGGKEENAPATNKDVMTTVVKSKDPADIEVCRVQEDVPRRVMDLSGARPIALNVILGDFIHNFADGVLIGAAFKGCSSDVGWTVTYATLAHEFSQELADWFVLTSAGNLTPLQASMGNLFSQSSVVLGGIVMCSIDITLEELGYILAFGGGTYLYIGLTECIPRYLEILQPGKQSDWRHCLAGLVFFLIGLISIGLVLLDHEHCDAGGDHEGHDHR